MVQQSKRFIRHFFRNKRTDIPYLTKRSALPPIKEIMTGSDSEDVISPTNSVELDYSYEQLSSNSSASESHEDETDTSGLLRPVPSLTTPLVALPHLFSPSPILAAQV